MTVTTPDDFVALYIQHLDFVWRNLRALGVPAGDLDDAAQDTFVVAYRRRNDFHDGTSVRAWLYGIARRVASRQRRGGGRRARLAEALAAQPREAPSLEALAQQHEAWRAALAFLDQLPPAQREAFWLTEVEGLTAAQAGAAIGVSSNTISSRLRAARLALARHGDVLRARDQGELGRGLRRAGAPSARQRRRAVAALGTRVHALAASSTVASGTGLYLGAAAAAVAIAVGVSVSRGEPAPPRPPPSVERPTAHSAAIPEPPLRDAPAPTSESPNEPPPPLERPTPTPRSARPTSAPKPSAASSLAQESKLVRAIQAALRDDPAHALALVSRHHARFPHGVLTLEADALAVQASCALGKPAKAQTHAARLPSTHAWSSGCRTPEKNPTSSDASGEGGSK